MNGRTRCACARTHERRRVVLTGGPGAGKTAVLEMLRHSVCPHVVIVPEAAGILFGGGFPRASSAMHRRAEQRAIYHVQLELETITDEANAALQVCDRGVVDGFAYWPGPDDFWSAMGTTAQEAFARYDAVIHLRTPRNNTGYGHQNPLRTETPSEAAKIDARISAAWAGHPHCVSVDATPDFLVKATQAIAMIQAQVPLCCRPAVHAPRGSMVGHVDAMTTRTGQLAP